MSINLLIQLLTIGAVSAGILLFIRGAQLRSHRVAKTKTIVIPKLQENGRRGENIRNIAHRDLITMGLSANNTNRGSSHLINDEEFSKFLLHIYANSSFEKRIIDKLMMRYQALEKTNEVDAITIGEIERKVIKFNRIDIKSPSFTN